MKTTIKQQVEESLQESINKLKQEKDFCLLEELTYSYDVDNYSLGDDIILYNYILELYHKQYGSNAYSDKVAYDYLKSKNMIVKNNGYISNVHKNKKIIKLNFKVK